jgi:hypothetical protein
VYLSDAEPMDRDEGKELSDVKTSPSYSHFITMETEKIQPGKSSIVRPDIVLTFEHLVHPDALVPCALPGSKCRHVTQSRKL